MTGFVRRALVVLGLAALAFVVWKSAYALLLGFGAVVAAPMLVVAMVWTNMLYMQDVLGEPVQLPGAAR